MHTNVSSAYLACFSFFLNSFSVMTCFALRVSESWEPGKLFCLWSLHFRSLHKIRPAAPIACLDIGKDSKFIEFLFEYIYVPQNALINNISLFTVVYRSFVVCSADASNQWRWIRRATRTGIQAESSSYRDEFECLIPRSTLFPLIYFWQLCIDLGALDTDLIQGLSIWNWLAVLRICSLPQILEPVVNSLSDGVRGFSFCFVLCFVFYEFYMPYTLVCWQCNSWFLKIAFPLGKTDQKQSSECHQPRANKSRVVECIGHLYHRWAVGWISVDDAANSAMPNGFFRCM